MTRGRACTLNSDPKPAEKSAFYAQKNKYSGRFYRAGRSNPGVFSPGFSSVKRNSVTELKGELRLKNKEVRIMKRVFAVMLALVMVLTQVPSVAFAEEGDDVAVGRSFLSFLLGNRPETRNRNRRMLRLSPCRYIPSRL